MTAVIDPVYVGLGGAVGAVLRYTVGRTVETSRFPLATLLVNVLGSFVLGLVMFSDPTEAARLFVGVGVCGGFTTFSTFCVDTVQLVEDGESILAAGYALGNVAISATAIGIAWVLIA